jgi:hypothetical protein
MKSTKNTLKKFRKIYQIKIASKFIVFGKKINKLRVKEKNFERLKGKILTPENNFFVEWLKKKMEIHSYIFKQ